MLRNIIQKSNFLLQLLIINYSYESLRILTRTLFIATKRTKTRFLFGRSFWIQARFTELLLKFAPLESEIYVNENWEIDGEVS